MLEREPISAGSLNHEALNSLQVPPPPRLEREVSRHFYTKSNRPVMMAVKLEGGADDRFFYTESNVSAQWSRSRPPTFLPVLYNHDEIKRSGTEPIFYVETEPEADMLAGLGLVATTYGRAGAIPPYQKDMLQGRTILAIGRAGQDGEVHINAVEAEFRGVATVRTFLVGPPSGATPRRYTLGDWLNDTKGEEQRAWLLGLARGERYPGSLPHAGSGRLQEKVSRPETSSVPENAEAAQQAPQRSAKVFVFGVAAAGLSSAVTANCTILPLRRPLRPGIVMTNDPRAGLEPKWLVEGVLPMVGAGMIYAPSKAGKSFIGIDLCYAVENGLPWGERGVKPGRAIYVASEYSASVWRRARHQFEAEALDRPFTIIQSDVLGHQLSGDSNGIQRLIEDIDHARGPDDIRLVFIDTFETIALGVDENSSGAVGQVWDCFAKIAARFNCFVLVAHHTGKSGDSYRGSSTLMNRPETVLSINVSANGRRRLEIEKQRDGVNGLTAEFDLETDPGTSYCRPVFRMGWQIKAQSSSGQSETPKRDHKESKVEQVQSAILEVLEGRYDDTGVARLTKEELRQHPSIISSAGTVSKDAFRKCLTRAVDALSAAGLITVFGNLVMRLDSGCWPPDTVPDMSTLCPDNPFRSLRQTG